MAQGKKYKKVLASVDQAKLYSLADAVDVLAGMKDLTKFDQTVDVVFRLGVDVKQTDQQIRGAANLPHGLGKTIRVLAFAKGEKEQEAKDAGADFVGGQDLVDKVVGGWLDFDRVVSTPDMMALVSRAGKILGPRSLMPNPKTGTVTFEIGKAVKDCKLGQVSFRTDKAGIIHGPIGKLSFEKEKLVENFKALLDTVKRLKPASSKGVYLKGVSLSATMSPAVKLDLAQFN